MKLIQGNNRIIKVLLYIKFHQNLSEDSLM